MHGTRLHITIAALLATTAGVRAQKPQPSFEAATAHMREQLQSSVTELSRIEQQIADDKLPLSRKLTDLETRLLALRSEYQSKTRTLDSKSLDLDNLRTEVKKRKDQSSYLQNLLTQYVRNFESRVHIAEKQRYDKVVQTARLAVQNTNMPEKDMFAAQLAVLDASLERLREVAGGTVFDGSAVDSSSVVDKGRFALLGPLAIFRSADGKHIGTAEQQLNSYEPAVVPFHDPADTAAAAELIENGHGSFPVDTTLGNAHKIEATHETLFEHIKKGGPVMVPIFAMAAAALLVALYKWLVMIRLRTPSRRQIDALLAAVGDRDQAAAERRASEIRGPTGRMLSAGVQHLREPRELIEEVMYETVLTTRLQLQGFLPFVAICAASAPLLGLLGTVTGIIDTFKLIEVFGSGDVKSLSGGISEALITTEFGLIVAIPSLLIHAYLSRKARGVVSDMERAAVAFINQISKTPLRPVRHGVATDPVAASATAPDPSLVRAQVGEILTEMLGPLTNGSADARPGAQAG